MNSKLDGADGGMVIGFHRLLIIGAVALFAVAGTGFETVMADGKVEAMARQVGIRVLQPATSDRSLQKTAAQSLPVDRMSSRSRQRVSELLDNASQYRRMPVLQYEVNPSMFQYLVNHPDVAIATWRVMGISRLKMWQTSAFEYEAKAPDGSEGTADVLWRDANQCVFVVQGAYHSPLLPGAIEASALVWLRYRFQRTADNRIVVNQQIETFIDFPSAAVEAIARLATVVTNSILDRNVMEVSLYARMMSRATVNEPEWVEQVASRMDGVQDVRKVELARVARGQNPYQQQSSPNAFPGPVSKTAESMIAESAVYLPQSYLESLRQSLAADQNGREKPDSPSIPQQTPSAVKSMPVTVRASSRSVAPVDQVTSFTGPVRSMTEGQSRMVKTSQAHALPQINMLSTTDNGHAKASSDVRVSAPSGRTVERRTTASDLSETAPVPPLRRPASLSELGTFSPVSSRKDVHSQDRMSTQQESNSTTDIRESRSQRTAESAATSAESKSTDAVLTEQTMPAAIPLPPVQSE